MNHFYKAFIGFMIDEIIEQPKIQTNRIKPKVSDIIPEYKVKTEQKQLTEMINR